MQNYQYHDNYMPYQAGISPYINKNNSYHEDFIPNQTGYCTNVGRNGFKSSIYEQEMWIDRLM